MTLLIIIASAVFTLVAAYHLVTPFLSSRQDQLRFEVLDEDLRRIEELVARKATLLKTLRDVEFDYETGKISENDYRELKQRYERQAVEVMRDLDDIHGGRGWEETIDAELGRRLLRVKEKQAQEQTKKQAENQTQAERPSPASVVVCPDCSKEMEADARFCSQCGTTIADDGDDADDSENPAAIESHALPRSGSEVAT